ncbi:MAG: hypothetical protein MZV64_07330 [Ignavibacteriales bacterium]|nr:hypothetical protein [Ignavibacteriales bacterium]
MVKNDLLTVEDEIKMGLRFTFSHAVATALTASDANLFRTALKICEELKPLNTEEFDFSFVRFDLYNP